MLQTASTFLVIAVIFVLGLVSYLKDKIDRKNQYFFYFTIFLCFWLTFLFYEDEIRNINLAQVLLRLDYMFASLVVLFFFLFCLNFPKINMNINKEGFIIIPSIFFFILAATDLVIKNIRFRDSALVYDMGFLYYLYALYIVTYLGGGVLNLLFKLAKSKGKERIQILYVCLGFFISSSFVVIFDVFVQPLFKAPQLISRMGIWGMVFFVGFTTYAITKHRLMDITVVIGRTSAFALVTLAYLGTFVGLWSALIYFHVPQVILLMITLIYLVFTGLTFRDAWVATQTTADKTFIKGWYDYRVVQRKISESLRKITEKEELLPAVRKILDEELEIREVQIDFQEGKTNLLPPSLIEEIKHTKNIIPLPKESILPQGVVIPCFSNERLEALILVGPKRTEIPFNEEDMDLFRTLADEVYVVLQRVKPLEKAKADLAVEKVKLEIAQRELERTHRLASLGTLAAGLAHEIRNPMMALSSQAELLPKKLKDEEFLLWFSKMVPEQIFRILNIVNRMLKFAKAKEEGLVKVNINKILEDILAMIEGKIRDKNIEVVKEFKTDKTISGNPDALSETFLNIIINGIDFMDRGGTLTLITKEENTNLVVVIKDTGVGIPEDKLEHIFDPFYTSRAEG